MHRRDFLKGTGLVTTSMLVPGFLKAAFPGVKINGRRLVVVQLSGGNDGLNTIVPWSDDAYHAVRGSLALNAQKVLRVSDDLGLHPALASLRHLFDEGLITVVNGVGYPNPDRSHFRSMDIWHTASDSDQYLTTGWLGRFLDHECQHPYQVLEFGPRLSLANTGTERKAISLTDPRRFHAATREPYFAHLAASGAHTDQGQLGYLYKTMAETYESATYLNEKLRPREPAAVYPKTEFARALRQIAGFISEGLDANVYYASTSGFDTHVNQAVKHDAALRPVADGIAAFIADLKANGLLEETLVMVFSEFGRRVRPNASKGTDHGTAGNLWLLGGGLRNPGFYNGPPSLTDLDENGDLRYTVDFRSVYATVLEQWLAVDAGTILTRPFDPLPGLLE